METNPNRSGPNRKEIRCRDCGHIYLIAWGQKSSRCQDCGNIEFHADDAQPLLDLASPISLLKNRVLEKAQKIRVPEPTLDPLLEFQKPADGSKVEDILVAYQVEWQLWAALVKNFQDSNYHAAYLSQIAMRRNFDLASERYLAHRSAMSLLREDAWQAEVADQMLVRIEAISAVGMQSEAKGFRPPQFLYLLPFDGRVVRFSFFLMGFYLLFKLLSF